MQSNVRDLPENMRTNVLTFDLHHRWFLVLLSHLEAAVESRSWGFMNWGGERVGEYLAVHNACEEHSMARFSFPGLGEHRLRHQGLVDRWTLIRMAIEAKTLTNAQLAEFREILCGHIRDHDRAYSDYYDTLGIQAQANNVLWEDGLALMPAAA